MSSTGSRDGNPSSAAGVFPPAACGGRGWRDRALAALTIVAIAGTLTACGRYGRPVRPVPVSIPEAASETADPTDPEETSKPRDTAREP